MASSDRSRTRLGFVTAQPIDRGALLSALREHRTWDVVIIGGGATGLGIAVDAASRGLSTALIEAKDFASGTSSRSSKLVHGGVRYLAQGNVKLVREALAERAILLANAPQLVRPLEFIVPCYRPLEREFLRVGLGLYDALAGDESIGPTRWLSRTETLDRVPGLRLTGLRGGVSYWDAQFDDARLAIALMRTAHRLGAIPINYVEATAIELEADRVGCVVAIDRETGERLPIRARVVFNATGVWVDGVRKLADSSARSIVKVSRGSHVLVPRAQFPADLAMTIPRTSDGRVLFVLPWRDALMLGTTDVPTELSKAEPQPTEEEIEFILQTARAYLDRPLDRSEVIGCFAGLRPLFAPHVEGATKTISREHSIVVEHNNLITVTGGKWTTYRRMADDAMTQAARVGLLSTTLVSHTDSLRLDVDPALESDCHDAERSTLEGFRGPLAAYARRAARFEQAQTVEDLFVRRMRLSPEAERRFGLSAEANISTTWTAASDPHAG